MMTISMTHCQMTVVMMKSELGPELHSTRYISYHTQSWWYVANSIHTADANATQLDS